MLLFLLLVLGVGTALSGSSSEDSEDTPSKAGAGFLKSRSAARDMSYSSSFGSEDWDSPDIPSDFHQRWGINKTWHAKTPHPLISRRASFEDYGRARVAASSEEDSSEEQLSTSSEHGLTGSHTRQPMTSKPNPKQSTPKSTIHSPSREKRNVSSQDKAVETTGLPSEKVTKGSQNRPAPKQPQTVTTLKSVPPDNIETKNDLSTQKSQAITPSTMNEAIRLTSAPSTTPRIRQSDFLAYTTTVVQELSTDNSLSTSASRFKTRTWGPPLPKMVPLLGVTFLVGGSAYMVYHASHASVAPAQTT